MTNAELISGLRECATVGDCNKCKMHDEYSYDMCAIKLLLAVADALEAADKRIAVLNTKCADLQSKINSMENEIEELIPKRGEWIDGDARHVTARCSVCRRLRLGNGAEWANKYVRFCENCGARMDGERKEQNDEQTD